MKRALPEDAKKEFIYEIIPSDVMLHILNLWVIVSHSDFFPLKSVSIDILCYNMTSMYGKTSGISLFLDQLLPRLSILPFSTMRHSRLFDRFKNLQKLRLDLSLHTDYAARNALLSLGHVPSLTLSREMIALPHELFSSWGSLGSLSLFADRRSSYHPEQGTYRVDKLLFRTLTNLHTLLTSPGQVMLPAETFSSEHMRRNLTSLTHLAPNHPYMIDPLASLGNLSNLRVLVLGEQSHIHVATLKNFRFLEHLHCTLSVDGLRSDSFASLTSLKKLTVVFRQHAVINLLVANDDDAPSNQLCGLFTCLTNLNHLSMAGGVGADVEVSLTGLSKLTTLELIGQEEYLSGTQLKGKPLLRELHLYSVSISDNRSLISLGPTLETLGLFNSSVTDDVIKHLTNLRSLHIMKQTSKITDEAVSFLTRLRELCVTENKNITPNALREMSSLAKLTIYEVVGKKQEEHQTPFSLFKEDLLDFKLPNLRCFDHHVRVSEPLPSLKDFLATIHVK